MSRPPPLTPAQLDHHLGFTLTLQNKALHLHGKRPFAAILIAPDDEEVLLTHLSLDHVNHAESCLARLAASQYSPTYLWQCTLISTWEPCAMCSGTIYWANIGRVYYAASEAKLKELTGVGNPENFTMHLPCESVFAGGQKSVEVFGPIPRWEERVVVASDMYWKPAREKFEEQIGQGINSNGGKA